MNIFHISEWYILILVDLFMYVWEDNPLMKSIDI